MNQERSEAETQPVDPAKVLESIPPGQEREYFEKQEQIALLQEKARLEAGLPHMYGWKWYKWAREFFESRNRMNFLCAANQISKSSTQIRKCIDWATNQELWPSLWRVKPMQFWYLYPSKDVADIEFETKWKLFLPKPELQNHPIYGWEVEKRNKHVFAIHFHSGVHVYFKTYQQDVQHLQTGTCDAIFCDEELPVELLDELLLRLAATDGYFHMVFTATLGQHYWKRTIEPSSEDDELYPDALKLQVSMFDCLFYEDGSPSHWTNEKIHRQIKLCSTKAQVKRRIYGKFAVDEGLVFESFDRERNMKPRRKDQEVAATWHIYGAADVGSGGPGDGHPAACVFVAVDPTYRQARVFKAWRGDGITTTAGDVVKKFLEMQGSYSMSGRYYDQGCKDFDTISTGMKEPFQAADKSHEVGEGILNVLFKNQMLWLYEGDPEIEKLAAEMESLRRETPKNKAKDDLCDALRYAVSQIPWDLTFITGEPTEAEREAAEIEKEEEIPYEIRERRRGFDDGNQEVDAVTAEINEFNSLYGNEP